MMMMMITHRQQIFINLRGQSRDYSRKLLQAIVLRMTEKCMKGLMYLNETKVYQDHSKWRSAYLPTSMGDRREHTYVPYALVKKLKFSIDHLKIILRIVIKSYSLIKATELIL